jgi:hypothetical protein
MVAPYIDDIKFFISWTNKEFDTDMPVYFTLIYSQVHYQTCHSAYESIQSTAGHKLSFFASTAIYLLGADFS